MKKHVTAKHISLVVVAVFAVVVVLKKA